METDLADYCSNDSDFKCQISSRTSTPPKLKSHLLSKKGCVGVGVGYIYDAYSIKSDWNKAEESKITFIVGKSEERVEIRKYIALLRKSKVLKTQILDAISRGCSEIDVKEWEPKVFKAFLQYLDTDVFKTNDMTDYVELVRLCVVYDVPKLLAQVCPLAKQSLSLENCVELYLLGAMNDIDDLRAAAYNYFLRMGNAFLEHWSFLNLDCITLSILIASDDFPIVEITLFNRLIDWVTHQCKRLNYPADRKEFFGRVAGLLFKHVRYVQMTPKEFRMHVLPSGLLNQKEIEAVNLRHRTHPGLWGMLPTSCFLERPRMTKIQFAVPLYNSVQIGFRKIAGTSSVIQESVRFLVSHDNIFLTSIGFFGPAKSDRCANGSPLTAYTIKILVEGDYSRHYCKCPAQNATIITRDNFSIDLNHPFRIQRLEPYKLTVWIDGEVTQFGVFPLPQAIVLIQDKGELLTFHFGDADTDPQPLLEPTGAPTSAPTIFHQPHSNNRQHYKQEPRMSGVIRCISFVIKDR